MIVLRPGCFVRRPLGPATGRRAVARRRYVELCPFAVTPWPRLRPRRSGGRGPRHRLRRPATGSADATVAADHAPPTPGVHDHNDDDLVGPQRDGRLRCNADQRVSADRWYRGAVAQSSGVAYVGGDFTAITDGVTTLPRQHLVAVTEANGQPVRVVVADTDGMVDALAVVGNKLYLAGSFTTVNGAARKNLARVDVLSGALDTSFSLDANNVVYDLWLDGTRLYLSGDFTNVGGAARAEVAAWTP